MGTPWNGIDRNKKPRQISKKKQAKMVDEKLVREKVKEHANGHCEACGELPCAPTYQISCHEKVFRSAGGKISELNSIGVCDICHFFFQHFLINHKEQCLRTITQVRQVDYSKSLEIYNKIHDFAEAHGLLRESKIKHG